MTINSPQVSKEITFHVHMVVESVLGWRRGRVREL